MTPLQLVERLQASRTRPSERTFALVEQRSGVTLPEAYRLLLRRRNGVWCRPRAVFSVLVDHQEVTHSLDDIYGLTTPGTFEYENDYSGVLGRLTERERDVGAWPPEHSLVFGSTELGDELLLMQRAASEEPEVQLSRGLHYPAEYLLGRCRLDEVIVPVAKTFSAFVESLW